jgi:hypothetical protein
LVNHWIFFTHFQKPPPRPTYDHYTRYGTTDSTMTPSFNEVASFFGICVWLVPFTLFISLSAGDNVLPTSFEGMSSSSSVSGSSGSGLPGADGRKKGMGGMAKQAIDGVREYVGDSWELLRGNARPGGGLKKF